MNIKRLLLAIGLTILVIVVFGGLLYGVVWLLFNHPVIIVICIALIMFGTLVHTMYRGLGD